MMKKKKNNKVQTEKSKVTRTKDYKNIRQIIVEEECELLEFLLKTFKDQSRNSVKSLLSSHRVSVDGAPITQYNFKLFPKDVVIITKEPIKKKIRKDLPIIFENDEMIIINKPSGLLSVPSDNEKGSTAYRMVTDYVQQKDKHNRVFVVHRLDEDTSGVLMFIKNKKLCDLFQDSWNTLAKKRGYIAIVEGVLKNKSNTIKSFLVKNSQNLMYSSPDKGGQFAVTHYKVIKETENYSMLDVNIDTGRKNQIRVHMSEMGHHVIGDDKYGKPSNPIKRLGLHAYELSIIHPVTKKLLTFKAPVPKEFETLFDKKTK